MSLSEDIIQETDRKELSYIFVSDVREAVKELKEIWVLDFVDLDKKIFKAELYHQKINEIFGEELT